MSWKDKSKILISPLRRIFPEHNSIFRDATSYKDVMALHDKGDYKKAYDILSRAIALKIDHFEQVFFVVCGFHSFAFKTHLGRFLLF